MQQNIGRRILLAAALVASPALGAEPAAQPATKVSYYKQIRPIMQANCQGCHQPAKAGGEYVMTEFARLIAGGETGGAAVVAGKPDEGSLLSFITPTDGKAKMPKGKKPLTEAELDLIKRWIAEGATDDTPAGAKQRHDVDHPPTYTLPPVVTSLEYSPDGKILATSGFHEVLLHNADGSGLIARLIGLSERIESIRFSPDGKLLAVTGGQPARMGEVQIWDVETKKLKLSVPVTYDTVYGASWSPDGKVVAFGCADNSLRAIDAKTGEQVLFSGAHNDWVFDTTFSVDGKHLISVGRDMTAKLVVVEEQRFIDNITSITPGALKGGIAAVRRHPTKNEILVGGSDGAPKLYRMFRETKRVIGDDANLIREFPALKGRVFSVDISRDGSRIAAGSSLNNTGEVRIYAYDFDTNLPDNIKKIAQKRSMQRTAKEKEELEKYKTKDVKLVAETDLDQTGIYAVAFQPDGKLVATGGSDGKVRLIDPESGKITREFVPVPLADAKQAVAQQGNTVGEMAIAVEPESPGDMPPIASIEVQPAIVKLAHRFDYAQLLVTGKLASGDSIDLTRLAKVQSSAPIVETLASGVVRPKADGKAELTVTFADKSVKLPVEISGFVSNAGISYIRHVTPVASKLGCNAGTCHGSKDGKNGFKLSLRGYDPEYDIRAFTDDLASRRTNIASPQDSLMLLKATGSVPHVGGEVTKPGSVYYEVLRQWIAQGARLDMQAPRVKGIEIFPKNPIIQKIGTRQQMRVVATYADGSQRDVTLEAHTDSGNTEVAAASKLGLMTAVRRGEAPVITRYEGAYAATTLTVMGERAGFVWQAPPANNEIDKLVAKKLERMKILPSGLCTDAEFIRRVYLDLTGLPPSPETVRKFLGDARESKIKRDEVIDQLIGSKEYIEHWTNKWADLLQVNRKFLDVEGSKLFREWIRDQVASNAPYDKFVHTILTANGSNKQTPPASYYKILRTPAETMENTTHLFLAVRFNCNKCHDHPFERWTQDQYYHMAAYFARTGLKKDPESGDKQIAGTAVEAGKPLYEIVYDMDQGEVTHDRTGQVTPPAFPYANDYPKVEKATRRQELANWITSKDNQYFAKSYVNRIWGYLLGVGLIEPLDDIRAGNPATNPELLDWLTNTFVASGFNTRELMRVVCKSRTYQLDIQTNKWNADDKINYSHAMARRLPAEVLYDAIHFVTGTPLNIPGVAPGTRAAELPDAGITLPDGFLANLGKPARESSCECERTSTLQLGPVMALVSGPTVGEAISHPSNAIAKLVSGTKFDQQLIDELYLRILGRPARKDEIDAGIEIMESIGVEHQKLVADWRSYEVAIAPKLIEQEIQRQDSIKIAKVELDSYEQAIAPREAELDRKQKERTEKLVADLGVYEKTLPAKLVEWEKQQSGTTVWTVLDLDSLKATNNAKLTKEKDLSIFASDANGRGKYIVTAKTELAGVTAVRLEVLNDDRLPGKGPGRAPDGNFVLTEFDMKWAPADKPKEAKESPLDNAKADFSQAVYEVKTAIDNKRPQANNGWAIAPQYNQRHVATFELKEPIAAAGAKVLTFELDQNFTTGQHSIGRFRLSVTTSPKPVTFGLSDNVAQILAVKAEARNEQQKNELLAYYRGIDEELKKRQAEIEESKKPRPIDPKLKDLRERFAEVSLPTPLDPTLRQFRHDVDLSTRQIANRRLTGAQDIAWALINSPAFLFNH